MFENQNYCVNIEYEKFKIKNIQKERENKILRNIASWRKKIPGF